ncbi:MAG: dethiobiotin synthase [Kiritimatiellales bacterium]|nr:dethiobiotin synthase [Kiritimatiellales bacterium]MCF7863849.1 dethiobiotin synthase [Kiritimatiellales bacterium]
MNGIFVTGTDTGIGKTALSALLLAELRHRGINAVPMKPVQTGCKAEGFNPKALDFRNQESQSLKPKAQGLSAPDLDYSLSMASMEVDFGTYRSMAPYRFEPACSPHLAAEMAGTEIEIAEIVIAARTLAAEYGYIVAEGAGGIMVPLNRHETMLDLMQAMKLPILIAARPGLGTINHTLLSIRALRSDGLDIAGVVFVASTPGETGIIEDDNAAAIEQFGKVKILGTIPYCPQLQTTNPDYANLPIPVVAEIEKIVNQLAI